MTPAENVANILRRLWFSDYEGSFRRFGAYRIHNFGRLATLILWRNGFTPTDFCDHHGPDAIAALISAQIPLMDQPMGYWDICESPEWQAVERGYNIICSNSS